jgi:hypothetical protein
MGVILSLEKEKQPMIPGNKYWILESEKEDLFTKIRTQQIG